MESSAAARRTWSDSIMSNELQSYAAKLSYPCIFAKSPEGAAENLFAHISGKHAGFDEGYAQWLSVITEMLKDEFNKQHLNYVGSSFSDQWWESMLRMLQEKLTEFARTEGG